MGMMMTNTVLDREASTTNSAGNGLSVVSIAKSYDKRVVLSDVSLAVGRGEVVGLLGPNGAGKTTCFYSIMGLVRPDGGRIELDGQDITHLPMYRRAILGLGYLPQETSIFRGLTVEQNIMAVLELAEPNKEARAARLEQLLEEFGLTRHFEATYSGVLDKRHVIHRILSEHRLNPAETAFVGDMTHDIETARHGGISSIAVLTGYQDAAVLAAVRPDLTVPDLAALRELLSRPPRPNRPIATVGALLHDEQGRVLLVRTHKWGNRWGIPGGKIREGEASLDALRREIREETALEITDIRFAMAQDCIHSPEFHQPSHFILLNYLARARPGAVRLNHEAEEFRWLHPADALTLPLNQPTRILLAEALHQALIPHAPA